MAIYFIQEIPDGLIKIGYSNNVAKRITQLRGPNGGQLELLAYVEGANRHAERRLHKRFAAQHVTGEWFHPAPELLDYIERARGKTAVTSARDVISYLLSSVELLNVVSLTAVVDTDIWMECVVRGRGVEDPDDWYKKNYETLMGFNTSEITMHLGGMECDLERGVSDVDESGNLNPCNSKWFGISFDNTPAEESQE